MITLSEKAGWVLARMMGCFDPPANLARMEKDGIMPSHFADPEFAERQLLDRQLDVEVSWAKRGDKEFADVVPIKPMTPAATDAPPASAPPASPPTTEAPPAEDEPGMTKAEAWAEVCAAWSPDRGEERNAAWIKEVRKFGKPEAELTPQDWAHVAKTASLPF
jgi:hypothetical protein